MQQSADNRPKSKFALIKRVFSTYTKNRKIVIVKYKKPNWRLYDKDEFEERRASGSLDEPYDEEDDEKLKPPPGLKRKGSATESDIASSAPTTPTKQPEMDEKKSVVVLSGGSSDFHCVECSRTFPNLVRFHAHMQIHKSGSKKRKLPLGPGKSKRPKVVVEEEEEEERILQVDGETDLDDLIGIADAPPASAASQMPPTSTTVTMAQITQAANGQLVVNAPQSAFTDFGGASIVFSSSSTHPPTHLLILKRHPGDSRSTDAGSFIQLEPTSSVSVLTRPTLTTVASSIGGMFRCDLCSESFRSRKALNNHTSNVHSVSKFTSVYPCTQCNSLFRQQADLESHIR